MYINFFFNPIQSKLILSIKFTKPTVKICDQPTPLFIIVQIYYLPRFLKRKNHIKEIYLFIE